MHNIFSFRCPNVAFSEWKAVQCAVIMSWFFRRVLNDRQTVRDYTPLKPMSQVKWGSLIQPSHYNMSEMASAQPQCSVIGVIQTCLALTAECQLCFRASSEMQIIWQKRVPRVKPQRAQQQNCFQSKSTSQNMYLYVLMNTVNRVTVKLYFWLLNSL